MTVSLADRIPKRAEPQRLPRAVEGEPGLFVVDGSWGIIAPLDLGRGVQTVGELEVIAHIAAGDQLIDTRLPEYVEQGTLESARAIAHTEIEQRAGEVDRTRVAVLFCNGPQCPATPQAIETLLSLGHPGEMLRFYRGGIHDWVTLGLPLAESSA